MKILIITQAVDENDTTLGFFCSWLNEFSKRAEKVSVICLREGEYNLPKNVEVFSLGKEIQNSKFKIQNLKKIRYIISFYKHIWRLRNEYDVVFVHMNQEYVLLGGIFWPSGKKIFFWRNHRHGDMFTRIAVFFSNKVFYTSKHSFTARFKKAEIMPAGIDTHIFQKNLEIVRTKNSLLMFGRIAPVKKIETAIDVLAELKAKGIIANLSVVGDVLPKDAGYLETLKDRVEISGINDSVRFEKGVSFEHAPAIYQSHEIFLNFTPSGSFDKTIVEAVACGAKVLVSNESMKNLLPEISFTNGNVEDIVKKIERLLNFDEKSSTEYFEQTKELVRNQSLDMLMEKLFQAF